MPVSLVDNVIIPQHFGSLLYVRDKHEYIPYDHLTTSILHASMESSLFELPMDLAGTVSHAQMDAFYRLGKRLKFFDRRGRFQGVLIRRNPPRDHLMGPLTLHLGITQDCDLKCRHCFSAPEMQSSDKRLLKDPELDRLFDECADLGCMRIALTGGEPLNRPDLFSIIDRIAERGIDSCLTTNGLRIDGDVARELQRRPFAWINVSLEGATPGTNDAVRGEGTFERVVSNLTKHLKRKVRFGLSITLNKLNLCEIPLFPNLARRVGAGVIMLRSCYPMGRAGEDESLCLTLSEYEGSIGTLRATNLPIQIVPTSCEAVDDQEDLAVIYENFGCSAGNTVATVYHNGDVSPCSLIGAGIELDNVIDKPFSSIWNEGAGFKRIRALTEPRECKVCDKYESCSGGCRARAWSDYNDLGAVDPWCKAVQ